MSTKVIDLLSSDAYPKKGILEKLICARLEISKEHLFLDPDRLLDKEESKRIHEAYELYTLQKKPLEYILGYVEFTGIRFTVTPKTLIPRPETEYMIEAVNEHISSHSQENTPFSILDIGTGCGVLGLAVYTHNKQHISNVLLSELDPATLDVAKGNAQRLHTDDSTISFVQSSLLAAPEVQSFLTHSPCLLVANLPYIPEELFDTNIDEGIKKWEPKMAFVGGDDGCDLYREMFDQLLALGAKPTMFLEMMTWQVDLLKQEYPQFTYQEVKTFHFNIRILKATYD